LGSSGWQWTHTQERGSLGASALNWLVMTQVPDAERELGRPLRNGERGRKMVELGLASLDDATSVKELQSFLGSIVTNFHNPRIRRTKRCRKWDCNAGAKRKAHPPPIMLYDSGVVGTRCQQGPRSAGASVPWETDCLESRRRTWG